MVSIASFQVTTHNSDIECLFYGQFLLVVVVLFEG